MDLISKIDDQLVAYLRLTGYEKSYVNSLGPRVNIFGGGNAGQAKNDLASVDSKSGPLLSHVSLMTAVLGILLSTVHLSTFKQIVFLAEIATYLFVAVCCLRCIQVESPEPRALSVTEFHEANLKEAMLKSYLFSVANRVAMYLTVILLISTPFVLILLP